MELQKQSHAEGGENLLITDNEADRLISLRISSSIPLPAEIAMMNGYDAKQFHKWMLFCQMMGVENHPFIQLLAERKKQESMASVLSNAPYLERAAHFRAYNSGEGVKIIDLAGGG